MRVNRLTLTAMFAAICAVGGLIKIPLGIGSTALDSTPALISAAFLPPMYSGVVALLGHVASALYAGFPLGPFHVIIALEMFVIVLVFARLHKANRNVIKWVFFIIANGVLAPLPFYFLISPAFFVGALPSIFIATVFNASIAMMAMPFLERITNHRLGEV